jgi:hypothetical protein
MFRATIIAKSRKTSVIVYDSPESLIKSSQFEKYARDNVFPDEHFNLMRNPYPFTANQYDIPESCMNPDFRFIDKMNNAEFYLATKFRAALNGDKIEWTNPLQLAHYQACQKEIPVFILLGLGNAPDNPCRLFLLPLDNARCTGIYLSEARKYEIRKEVPVSSVELWYRMAF